MPHPPLDLLLLRAGALTLLVSLLGGFAIPRLKNPRMAVGAHVTGVVNGVLLLVLGLIWPLLSLSAPWSEVGRWLAAISLPGLWFGLKLAAAVGAARTAPIAAAGMPNAAGPMAERVAVFFIAVPSLMMVAATIILTFGLFGLS
jgi:hydroxylaminobenzene mutase